MTFNDNYHFLSWLGYRMVPDTMMMKYKSDKEVSWMSPESIMFLPLSVLKGSHPTSTLFSRKMLMIRHYNETHCKHWPFFP